MTYKKIFENPPDLKLWALELLQIPTLLQSTLL